jgi:hypothetical protein
MKSLSFRPRHIDYRSYQETFRRSPPSDHAHTILFLYLYSYYLCQTLDLKQAFPPRPDDIQIKASKYIA